MKYHCLTCGRILEAEDDTYYQPYEFEIDGFMGGTELVKNKQLACAYCESDDLREYKGEEE